jgi:hypothetical protein
MFQICSERILRMKPVKELAPGLWVLSPSTVHLRICAHLPSVAALEVEVTRQRYSHIGVAETGSVRRS